MSLQDIALDFIKGMTATTWQEFVAVLFGIASVLYSRKEKILVYPTGIINTIMYSWFCLFWWNLYAEASLNIYYTVMSIYGWILWSRKKEGDQKVLQISISNRKEWIFSLGFFLMCWLVLYVVLSNFTKSTVPIADAFASASAYTGMLLMAKKKLENWIWWIITNIASIPLYFYKGAVFTSVQYVVFLVLAVMGYNTWKKKLIHGDS